MCVTSAKLPANIAGDASVFSLCQGGFMPSFLALSDCLCMLAIAACVGSSCVMLSASCRTECSVAFVIAVLAKPKKAVVSKLEKPETGHFRPLSPKFLQFFASRGISEGTLKRNQVAQEKTWMPGQPAGDAIAFPYLRNGEVVNVKYRTLDKSFRQVKGAEKILYGLDDVVGQDTIIIVEGTFVIHKF